MKLSARNHLKGKITEVRRAPPHPMFGLTSAVKLLLPRAVPA